MRIFLHVILPLVVGLIIYIIARPDSWLSHHLLTIFPTGWSYNSATRKAPVILQFVFNNGPDFCWNYSLASALFLWKYYSQINIRFFYWIVLVTMLSSEVIQLLFPAQFVFDIGDLIAAIVAVLLSYYLTPRTQYEKSTR